MERHTCKTYFAINLANDERENEVFKKEIEKFVKENFDIAPQWRVRRFVIGYNADYRVNVNEMLRITLKDLMGKTDKIKELCKIYGVKTSLVIVPYIVVDSGAPNPLLSLDKDIIEFLYKSNTSMDLDYYVC